MLLLANVIWDGAGSRPADKNLANKLSRTLIYGDVFERLEAEGVRYVAVGGVAVVLHGHERPVKDLDIVVDPAPAEARRATAALMSLGFVPTLPLPLEMLTVLTMLDGAGRTVDVFARYHVPFGELWSASERVSAGASQVEEEDATGRYQARLARRGIAQKTRLES